MNGGAIIVGAGVAGLTLAERLTASGCADVTVLERENSLGGLARTFEKDGFLFDIGPHRFHTSDRDVNDYLLSVLGGEYVTISRKSNVHMAGRYRNWPLTLRSVAGLPAGILLRSFLDLFRRKRGVEPATFADHVIARYGKTIYEFFFRDYTEKFTGCAAEELHVDWAEAGVNRAVIDRNVRADDLFSLMRSLLVPKPVTTLFYYPSTGGIQTFCEKQAALISKRGGKILLGCRAQGLLVEDGSVRGVRTSERGDMESDRVYWSAPLSLLYPEAGFRFMDTLVCNIALSRKQRNDYQWCYFGQKETLFSRLTVPSNFRPDTVPPSRDSLTAEITVSGESMRRDPESLTERLIEDLERVGALRACDIIFIDWKLVPETYPLYDLAYRERLAGLDIPSGLELIGRCGSFWYNNMDHSIGQALALASGREFSKDFWKH